MVLASGGAARPGLAGLALREGALQSGEDREVEGVFVVGGVLARDEGSPAERVARAYLLDRAREYQRPGTGPFPQGGGAGTEALLASRRRRVRHRVRVDVDPLPVSPAAVRAARARLAGGAAAALGSDEVLQLLRSDERVSPAVLLEDRPYTEVGPRAGELLEAGARPQVWLGGVSRYRGAIAARRPADGFPDRRSRSLGLVGCAARAAPPVGPLLAAVLEEALHRRGDLAVAGALAARRGTCGLGTPLDGDLALQLVGPLVEQRLRVAGDHLRVLLAIGRFRGPSRRDGARLHEQRLAVARHQHVRPRRAELTRRGVDRLPVPRRRVVVDAEELRHLCDAPGE